MIWTVFVIFRVHLDSWHRLGHCSSRRRQWGIRQTPKTAVVKELKLTSKGLSCEEDTSVDKSDDGLTEPKKDPQSPSANIDGSASGSQKLRRRKQLIQFDKSHRPAFYGYWPRKRYVMIFIVILYLLENKIWAIWYTQKCVYKVLNHSWLLLLLYHELLIMFMVRDIVFVILSYDFEVSTINVYLMLAILRIFLQYHLFLSVR